MIDGKWEIDLDLDVKIVKREGKLMAGVEEFKLKLGYSGCGMKS